MIILWTLVWNACSFDPCGITKCSKHMYTQLGNICLKLPWFSLIIYPNTLGYQRSDTILNPQKEISWISIPVHSIFTGHGSVVRLHTEGCVEIVSFVSARRKVAGVCDVVVAEMAVQYVMLHFDCCQPITCVYVLDECGYAKIWVLCWVRPKCKLCA
jgi:hypothetical protein